MCVCIYVCVCITEPLCYIPEINNIEVNYMSIKKIVENLKDVIQLERMYFWQE